MNTNELLNAIIFELEDARNKYKRLNSTHEGYAVIKEEIDELWDAIKASKVNYANARMRNECIQIAAMAIRFIEDLCFED